MNDTQCFKIRQLIRDSYLTEDDLDLIQTTINWRRKRLIAARTADLAIGDRVRFRDTVKPQYMAAMAGTIVGRSGSKWVIRPDVRRGKYTGNVKAPASILDLVSEGGLARPQFELPAMLDDL